MRRSRWKRRRRRSSCRTRISAAPTTRSSPSRSRSSKATKMDRFAHYDWPFFEERHAKLAAQAEAWARDNLGHAHGDDADAICKRLVQDLGCAGYLSHAVTDTHDVRSIA